MRIVADVPVQKMLGMGSEAWNALTLAYALYCFKTECFDTLSKNLLLLHGIEISFWMGPGWGCYVICALSAAVRGIVHWLTPLPDQGKGMGAIFEMYPHILCCADDINTANANNKPIENNSQPESSKNTYRSYDGQPGSKVELWSARV